MDKTVEQATDDLKISCPNCKSVNRLADCIHKRELKVGLMAQGLLCPDCGHWTHSFVFDDELETRRLNLERIQRLYKQAPTPARWTNYQTSLGAYKKEFGKFQDKHSALVKALERQVTA